VVGLEPNESLNVVDDADDVVGLESCCLETGQIKKSKS
jgi:hypothetical protein